MDVDLDARIGQVWEFEDSVELIVRGIPPSDRLEARWVSLVLWVNDDDARLVRRKVGSFDHAGESAFAHAEAGDDLTYSDWRRIA